jgi:single-stranded DNA-binding protein
MTRGIEAALWASATRDAEIRESKAGNAFGIVNCIVHDGTTDDQGRQVGTFVKVLAFQQHVNTARTIKRGDRCYIEGQFSASMWKTSDGESRLDLTQSIQAGKDRHRQEPPAARWCRKQLLCACGAFAARVRRRGAILSGG